MCMLQVKEMPYATLYGRMLFGISLRRYIVKDSILQSQLYYKMSVFIVRVLLKDQLLTLAIQVGVS